MYPLSKCPSPSTNLSQPRSACHPWIKRSRLRDMGIPMPLKRLCHFCICKNSNGVKKGAAMLLACLLACLLNRLYALPIFLQPLFRKFSILRTYRESTDMPYFTPFLPLCPLSKRIVWATFFGFFQKNFLRLFLNDFSVYCFPHRLPL